MYGNYRVEYDSTKTLLLMAQGKDLLLPRKLSSETKNVPRQNRPILMFSKKGIVELTPEGSPLFLPTEPDGCSVRVQAGALAWDGASDQRNWKIRSLASTVCPLWSSQTFGRQWNPREAWFDLLKGFNLNLVSSDEGVLTSDTVENLLYTGEELEDYKPELNWPRFLVHEDTADELAAGNYVLKAGESLPTTTTTTWWKEALNYVFIEEDNDQKIETVATYLPFSYQNTQIFWMVIPKSLADLFQLEQWVEANRSQKHYTQDGQRHTITYQETRLAQVPWDPSKIVVWWFGTIAPRFVRHYFPAERTDLPYLLQTRWHGVTKIMPSMIPPEMNNEGDITFSVLPEGPISYLSIVDAHDFPIVDMQQKFTMKFSDLTSYYFQPWSHPGYLSTLILHVPELGIQGAILKYDSQNSSWYKIHDYEHSDGIQLPEKKRVVVYQGDLGHYIKLRERLDDGLDTLTVQLKSIDRTKFPKFYTGFTYVALHFRKTLTDLELENDDNNL